ncbi:MAG TPA: GNAT family N-acetyltransferase [Gammaproteobacteria bacterium]|nr:GNAT family N-acetyltransferase [Gammaproteobacteria bacterium]
MTKLAFHWMLGERCAMLSRWVLGIQRRTVYLVPPSVEDLEWMFDQFHNPEISEMFGYLHLGGPIMIYRYSAGALIVATIKLVATRERIGFLIMYPPAELRFWEFGYAIPDPANRNAFNALNSTDALAHYMFEHLEVSLLGWRTREDNRTADAVVRRLGYPPGERIEELGHRYTLYRLNREGWMKRREKLERGEARQQAGHPAFFVLPPPYEPIT